MGSRLGSYNQSPADASRLSGRQNFIILVIKGVSQPTHAQRRSSVWEGPQRGRGHQPIMCPACLSETLVMKSTLAERYAPPPGRTLSQTRYGHKQDDWPETTQKAALYKQAKHSYWTQLPPSSPVCSST